MSLINENNFKIFVCCHKECKLPEDRFMQPIQVGTDLSSLFIDKMIHDNEADESINSISYKNKSYCEMTALYWIWKNAKRVYPGLEYIGINHYRRFFAFDKKNLFGDLFYKKEEDVSRYHININKINNLLKGADIIIPKRKIYQYNLYEAYCCSHVSTDIEAVENIIKQYYPDYYASFKRVMIYNNKLAHYNMCIMSWTDFCNYCSWVFDILKKTEDRTSIEHYNNIQYRVYGYLAERLLNVWIVNNKLSVKYIPIYKYDSNKLTHWTLKTIIMNIRNTIAWQFTKPITRRKR